MIKELTIKTTAMQLDSATPLIDKIKGEIEKNGGSSTRIILAEKDGKICAFYEKAQDDRCLGLVKVRPGDAETSDLVLSLATGSYPYECRITSAEQPMSATLEVTGEVKKEEVAAAGFSYDENYCKKLVDDGFMTKENLDLRLKIAEEHNIPFSLLKDLCFEQIRRRGIKEELSPLKVMYKNTEEPDPKKPLENVFLNVFGNAAVGDACVLEGPKSVGKNVFCETIAFLFNKEYFVIQLNENTSNGDVYGEKSTDNSAVNKLTKETVWKAMQAKTLREAGKQIPTELLEAEAEFEYLKVQSSSVKIVQDLGLWVQWLQRGGVMVLNEMDMADANFFSQLVNMILDGTGFMSVPGYGRVDVNPDCVLIGTQNGADYEGTNNQNSASISRFDKYVLPQPKDVYNVLKAATKDIGLDDKYYRAANEFYKDLVKKTSIETAKGMLSDTCLNIRGMVRALKMVAKMQGTVTLKKRLMISVVNACSEQDRFEIINSLNAKVNC